MSDEYTPDLITLVSDDDEKVEFEILDIIENDEGKFYILYPYYENPADSVNDPGEYYIFESTGIEGEEQLSELQDDEKIDRIAKIFEDNYNKEIYDDEQ